MKTYEELEREAYMNGYVRLASSYATIIDIQEQLSMVDGIDYDQSDEIDELIEDVEYWRKRAIEAEGVLESLEK